MNTRSSANESKNIIDGIQDELSGVRKRLYDHGPGSLRATMKDFEQRTQRVVGLTFMARAKFGLEGGQRQLIQSYERLSKSMNSVLKDALKVLDELESAIDDVSLKSIIKEDDSDVEVDVISAPSRRPAPRQPISQKIIPTADPVERAKERARQEIMHAHLLRGYSIDILDYTFKDGTCLLHLVYKKNRTEGTATVEIRDIFNCFPSVITRYFADLKLKSREKYEEFWKSQLIIGLMDDIDERVEKISRPKRRALRGQSYFRHSIA